LKPGNLIPVSTVLFSSGAGLAATGVAGAATSGLATSGSRGFIASASGAGCFLPMLMPAASILACTEDSNAFNSILNCSDVIFEVGLFSISKPFPARKSTTVDVLMFKVVATCLSLIVFSSAMLKICCVYFFRVTAGWLSSRAITV
jgi:hypothetical protein